MAPGRSVCNPCRREGAAARNPQDTIETSSVYERAVEEVEYARRDRPMGP